MRSRLLNANYFLHCERFFESLIKVNASCELRGLYILSNIDDLDRVSYSLFFRLGRYITYESIRRRDFTFFGAITLRIVRRITCDKRNQTGRSCLPCTECTFERLEHSASFGNFYILWCIQIDKLILRSTVLYYNWARTCIRAVCYNDACSKRIRRQNRSMAIEHSFYKNERI